MLRFRDFTHSVQTGRPCRCFQVGEDISVQKGSPFGFIYLSGMFGDDGSNKNSFGGTGQENLAPRVGFFLWRYGLADIYGFDLTSASLESSQRYLELFRPVCEPTAG